MKIEQSFLLSRGADPLLQAGLTLFAVFLVMLVGKLVGWTGWVSVEQDFPWLTAASFLLFFSVFSSLISLLAKNRLKYWGRSVYSFMGLALGSGLMAWGFSSLAIGEAGSYRWIFIVVTISYLVFMSLVNIMRKIVEFAQKEEWNQPRLRKRD